MNKCTLLCESGIEISAALKVHPYLAVVHKVNSGCLHNTFSANELFDLL